MEDVVTHALICLLDLNVPVDPVMNWMLTVLPVTVHYSTYSGQFLREISGMMLNISIYFPCISDINECSDPSVCQFQCINTPGSFRCINFCSTGYQYDEMTNECLGELSCISRCTVDSINSCIPMQKTTTL